MVDSFSHASDEPVPLIDPPQQGAVVNDIPHPVVYLLESDVLVMESIAEEGLLCDPSERSGEARSAHRLQGDFGIREKRYAAAIEEGYPPPRGGIGP